MARQWTDTDWERLDRLLNHRGTDDELDALRRWVAADPQRQQLLAALQAARDSLDPPPRWDEQRAWETMSERMRATSSPPLQLTRGLENQQRSRRLPWTAAALAAGLFLVASVLLGRGARHLSAPRDTV